MMLNGAYIVVYILPGPRTNVSQSSAACSDISARLDSLTLAPVSTATSSSAGSLLHTSTNSGSTTSLPATVAGPRQPSGLTTAASADLISLATTTTPAAVATTTTAGSSTAGNAGNALLSSHYTYQLTANQII